MFLRCFGSWPAVIHVGTNYRAVLEGPICKGNRVMRCNTVQTVKKTEIWLNVRFLYKRSAIIFYPKNSTPSILLELNDT
jgi:hypothetical protein